MLLALSEKAQKLSAPLLSFFLVCFDIELLHLVFSPKETRGAVCLLPCKRKFLHTSVFVGVCNCRAPA